jgi:thiol-disulfide isomerase/thioredoxin
MRLLGVTICLMIVVAMGVASEGADDERASALRALNLMKPARQPKIEVGLTALDGEPFALHSLVGRVVILNFWATWCVPCRDEMPALERLAQSERDRGLVVVAVAADTKREDVLEFVNRGKFTFPIVMQPRNRASEVFGVRALPTTFVLDPSGAVVGVGFGPREWDGKAARHLVAVLARDR